MLKISELHKSYKNKTVLNNINVEFEDGHIYGIIGHNGAGKSTLYKCICSLESYKGHIYHNEFDRLNHNICFLETTPYFYPKLTGIEYLTFYRKIADKPDKGMIQEWNTLFELPLSEYIENYSTGMKKKISFLSLLLQEKPIYILDEPFNGLDMDSVLIFKTLIERLRSQGKTILISSHIISTLTDICDFIYLLENGNFIKSYNPSDYHDIENDLYVNIKSKILKITQTNSEEK